MKLETEKICGFSVTNSGLSEIVAELDLHISCKASNTNYIACLNPHSYAEAKQSPAFTSALNKASILLPDGVGIVLASKILGGSIQRRVTGYDIFEAVMKIAAEKGLRVLFLGSTAEVLSIIRDQALLEYEGLEEVNVYSPAFKDAFDISDFRQAREVVNNFKPDIVWVGMTAPKQEIYAVSCLLDLGVPVVGCIGAVFDFYIGRIRRPGRFWQAAGLEWLPRLFQEPERLWRRTFFSAPVFLAAVLRQFFQTAKK